MENSNEQIKWKQLRFDYSQEFSELLETFVKENIEADRKTYKNNWEAVEAKVAANPTTASKEDLNLLAGASKFQLLYSEVAILLKSLKTLTIKDLEYLELRSNNLCNFSCRTCFHEYSTGWVATIAKVKATI